MKRSNMGRLGRVLLVLMPVVLFGTTACASKNVSRIAPNSVTDLSGRWNDTDSRLVANTLIEQSLSGPWVARFANNNGGEAPTVIVGTFRNRSMEHIPVSTFTRDLERAFVNSGAVQVVASQEEREEIRGERADQQEFANAETRARIRNEMGANYMLQGDIVTIEDEEGREKVVFYQVNATLIDLESNAKVWIGEHEIKKYIERARFGS